MSRWPFKSGDHLAICDICGFRGYASELRKNYQGLMVHDRCFETQHPQEQRKPKQYIQKSYRPEGADIFLSPGDVTRDDL